MCKQIFTVQPVKLYTIIYLSVASATFTPLFSSGPPSQKKLHLLNYTANLANSSSISNLLVRNNVLNNLARQAKEAQHIDV